MWHVIRSALLWLIAVALPLHGAAAATMIACGPAHHGAAVAAAAQPAAAASHGHEHGAAPHAGHGHGPHAHSPAHGDHGMASQAADDAPDANSSQAGTSTCSVCASCCTAAALPPSLISIDPHPHADDMQPGLQAHTAVFMTDGPERPPRHLLA